MSTKQGSLDQTSAKRQRGAGLSSQTPRLKSVQLQSSVLLLTHRCLLASEMSWSIPQIFYGLAQKGRRLLQAPGDTPHTPWLIKNIRYPYRWVTELGSLLDYFYNSESTEQTLCKSFYLGLFKVYGWDCFNHSFPSEKTFFYKVNLESEQI